MSGEVDTEDRPRLGNGTLSAQAGKSSANLKGFFKKSASKTSSYEGKYKDADGKEVVYKEKKDDGRVKVKVPKGAKAGDTVEFDVGGGRLAKIVIPKGTKSGQVVEVKVPKEEANKSIESQPSVLRDPASAAISTASAAMTSIFGSVEQEVQDEDFQPTSLPATEKRQSVGLSTGTQEDKTNKLFDLLDRSHNGVLRKDEVVGAASILHMTEHEASMLFESLDVEGNGELTRSEFQKV